MKVLVAENNLQALNQLCDLLEQDGFETIKVQSGHAALNAYKTKTPDFLCLDIMMPDLSGYDVCREIRRTNDTIPIIFISAKSETVDKVLGLEIGADDYIVKPYDIHEVIARMRAVARRCLAKKEKSTERASFHLKDLVVYPSKLKAERNGQVVELSLREIKILGLLHDRKNEVVDRDTLLDYCWGAHIMPESRTLDWHISQLRKRIEKNPKEPEIIMTIHGVGYKYEES
jgi:DNA-binding response OmpR family regulator